MPNAHQHQQLVLLNRLVSSSKSKARDYAPPTHSVDELLQLLETRRRNNWAVEFVGAQDDEDERRRLENGHGHNFIRLRRLRVDEADAHNYAILLFEYVDESARSFPVVHTRTFEGRDLSGDEDERGATAAHLVIRMPLAGDYDDGSYRCTMEAVRNVNRTQVERFFSRQLARAQDWEFTVVIQRPRKPLHKSYKYRPRLQFYADVGRRLRHTVTGGQILSSMVFTRRDEHQSIGTPTSVEQEEIVADVDIKVSARQGPTDPAQRNSWARRIISWYERQGYRSRLYYRSIETGATISGEVHDAVASATDLLLCPKEAINLMEAPRVWHTNIHRETIEQMKILLDRDELWERTG